MGRALLRFGLVHPIGRLATAGSLLLAIFACVPKGKSVPDGGFDLKVEDLGPVKEVGSLCQSNADCGRDKICWVTNFFNKSDGPVIQGGYCTNSCVGDGDCQPRGACVGLVNTNTGAAEGNFCLLDCSDRAECNRSGVECWSGLRFDTGVCYATTPGGKTQKCNPSTQSCALSSELGGCVRRSFGGVSALGFCEGPCVIGKGTCGPDLLTGGPRQCLVVNPAVNRDGTPNPNTSDKFLGTACVPVSTAPRKLVGAGCIVDGEDPVKYYFDVCTDGAQCRAEEPMTANRLCNQLCFNPALATKPTPPMGTVAEDCPGGTTCQDVWNLFANAEPRYQVGLCR